MYRTVPSSRPATGSEIRQALGAPFSEEIVTDILRTGASPADIVQAREWLDNDDYIGLAPDKTMSARVRSVYQILREERESPDPDER